MGVHILEIKAVVVHGVASVGYGIDYGGNEYVVALDVSLAAEIAQALGEGKRPIVAVAKPLYPPAASRAGRVARRKQDSTDMLAMTEPTPATTDWLLRPLRGDQRRDRRIEKRNLQAGPIVSGSDLPRP
jgi:hypothetical protein